MRGIAGIVHLDAQPVAPQRIASLLGAMKLGSLDRHSCGNSGSAAFAHLQKDVTAEDSRETQPLRNAEDSLLLVTDALLDNRAELASAFGWPAHTACLRADSAFVLAAYEKWGESCVAHLEGKWALAIWHAPERRLFAAVDHFSFRPFYYVQRGRFFAFATTLRALLSLPEVSRELHDEILADYLLYTRSRPGQTLYREIESLPAAHVLHVDGKGSALRRYWQADPAHVLQLDSDADYQAAFREELERAVGAALRVRGSTGVSISGGLDSAAVTAVAGHLIAGRGGRLQAIHHLPPPGDPRRAWLREHDESAYVRQMQSHMPHVDFHFVPAGTSENLRVSFDRWNELLDEHTVPFRGFALARTDAPVSPLRGIDPRLMLSGLGGNYTVSLEAYPSCYFAQLAVQLRWSRLARELSGHARFYGATTRHLLKYRVLLPLLGRPAGGTADSRRLLLEYLNPDFVNRAGIQEKLRAAGPRWQRRDFNVRRSMAWILDELMPQNVGAAGAVIGRNFTCVHVAPLMSWRLNAFCLALPLEQQIRDGRDRLMLRHAMKGLLPQEVIWRKTRGFSTPDAWPAARAIVAALPGVLGELETSALAGRYLRGLPRIARGEESLLRRLGPNRIIDLFNVAWFLRWLERHPV